MAQTIWIGNLHFADVNVPVKLHTSVSQNRIEFHLFHKKDGIKLRQQMVCAYEDKPVSAEEQVKGYQVDERKYVLMDPEELELTEPKQSRNIVIHEFVKTNEIDPIFMERTYYLESETSQKGYGALAAALKETENCGICTWAMRKRAYLGALRSDGKTLRLTILRYADEVIPVKSLRLQPFSLSEKELNIAGELIKKLTAHFRPEKYKNEHQKKLKALIEKKAHGGKIALIKPRHLETTTPGKLLEVLEKSLHKVAA